MVRVSILDYPSLWSCNHKFNINETACLASFDEKMSSIIFIGPVQMLPYDYLIQSQADVRYNGKPMYLWNNLDSPDWPSTRFTNAQLERFFGRTESITSPNDCLK